MSEFIYLTSRLVRYNHNCITFTITFELNSKHLKTFELLTAEFYKTKFCNLIGSSSVRLHHYFVLLKDKRHLPGHLPCNLVIFPVHFVYTLARLSFFGVREAPALGLMASKIL